MKIIATSLGGDHNAVLFNSKNGEKQVVPQLPHHKDEGFNSDVVSGDEFRSYGITWDADNIFLGLRRHMLVYDNQMQEVEMLEDVLGDNTHQISYHKGSIVSAQTSRECLGFYDLNTQEKKHFHMRHGWVDEQPAVSKEDRVYRINSILCKGDFVYVLAKNTAPSDGRMYIYKFDPSAGAILESTELRAGNKCHGIFSASEGFFTLQVDGLTIKEQAVIREPNLERLPDEYRSKGMCGDESNWAALITSGNIADAGSRLVQVKNWSSDNAIEYQSQWVENLLIPQDMRQIDGFDKCHLNPFSFPYKGF